jgi:hypothetical protein
MSLQYLDKIFLSVFPFIFGNFTVARNWSYILNLDSFKMVLSYLFYVVRRVKAEKEKKIAFLMFPHIFKKTLS